MYFAADRHSVHNESLSTGGRDAISSLRATSSLRASAALLVKISVERAMESEATAAIRAAFSDSSFIELYK